MKSPVFKTRRTGAHAAEALPAVDTGVVPVVPNEPDGVVPDGEQLQRLPPHECRNQEDLGIRKLTHLVVSALALGARTGASKAVERVGRLVPVGPIDGQLLLRVFDSYAGGCMRLISSHRHLHCVGRLLFAPIAGVPGVDGAGDKPK